MGNEKQNFLGDETRVGDLIAPDAGKSAVPQADAATNYNPWLMALCNLIFPCGAYLALGHYVRQYVGLSLLTLTYIFAPAASYVIVLAIIVDSFLLTKKWNADPSARPVRKKAFAAIGVVAIIVCIGLVAFVSSAPELLARDVRACGTVYALNPSAKTMCFLKRGGAASVLLGGGNVDDDKNVGGSEITKDPTCDAYKSDLSLTTSNKDFRDFFLNACYFRKAYETGEGRHCLALVSIEAVSCLKQLVAATGNTDYCELAPGLTGKESCNQIGSSPASLNAQAKMMLNYLDCQSIAPFTDRCESAFGQSFAKLKAEVEARSAGRQ